MEIQSVALWPNSMARFCDLKNDLGITAGQSVAWNMFVYTVGAQTATVLNERSRATPQGVGRGAASDTVDAPTEKAALRTVKRAAEGLYAILTPEQRRRADGPLRGLYSTPRGDSMSAGRNEHRF